MMYIDLTKKHWYAWNNTHLPKKAVVKHLKQHRATTVSSREKQVIKLNYSRKRLWNT